MYLIKLTLFLLFSTSALEPKNEASLVQHPKYGWIIGTVLDGSKIKKRDPSKTVVNYSYYLSRHNKTSDSFEVEPQKIISQVKQTTLTLQGEVRKIAAGLVIIGKDKLPYVVDFVFADGRIALAKLRASASCGDDFSLTKTSCFRLMDENTNPLIESSSFINAIQQDCFLKSYCKDTFISSVNNIPLCALNSLDPSNKKPLGLHCGQIEKIRIDAAFSDGTLLLGQKTINLFPENTWRYYKTPPEETVPSKLPTAQ